jgi:hypothetical protein
VFGSHVGLHLTDLYFLSMEHPRSKSGRNVSGSKDFSKVLGLTRTTG